MPIYLIRHGQSAGNAENRLQGQSDYPLTATGRAQARLLGAWLAGQGLREPHLYASPLARAWETAELVAAALGAPAPLAEPALAEFHGGVIEGLTMEEIAAAHPRYETRSLADRGCMAEFGGESYEQLQARLSGFIERVHSAHWPHEEHDPAVLAVAHGGSLYQLLKLWCGWPTPRHYFTRISNCTCFKLRLRSIDGHRHAELQWMVPIELLEAGLATRPRFEPVEG